MSEDSAVDVRFTLPFKRRTKSLSKRYSQIQKDMLFIIEQLQVENFVGDRRPIFGLLTACNPVTVIAANTQQIRKFLRKIDYDCFS